jgi:hypothetical protein
LCFPGLAGGEEQVLKSTLAMSSLTTRVPKLPLLLHQLHQPTPCTA